MAGRRCADWRFPTQKQERAEAMARLINDATAAPPKSDKDAWWDSVLTDPRANATARRWASPDQMMSTINLPKLRVECLKCFKIIEVDTLDARRFYGGGALWKDVGRKMLEAACTSRTGNRDSDGCWPEYRRAWR